MWIFAAIGLPLALSGCADFKGNPGLEVKLPPTFQQQLVAQAPAKLQKNWWQSTADNTLLGMLKALETQNLSLEQARFRLTAARLNSRKFDYLPNLGGKVEANYTHLLEGNTAVSRTGGSQSGNQKTTGYYSATLDASWELPLYGQLDDADAITKANVAFAEADLDAIRTSVISEAIRLYADMRSRQQETLKRQAVVAAAQAIANYQSSKHKVGLLSDTELGISQQSLLTAQNQLHRAESEAVARMRQLAKLLGVTQPDKTWQASAAVPTFAVTAFDDTPLDVLRNRPDIRKAEASVLVAAGEFELSKTELYPKITLSGNLSQLANLTGNPLMGNAVQLSGMPALALPLFDWGKRLSAARIKDEKLSEKASSYRETVIGAMNEVEEFWSAYRTAQAVEKATVANTQIARHAHEHAVVLFKQGFIDGIAAQTAAINAANSAIIELQAKADVITTLAALTKALGGV